MSKVDEVFCQLPVLDVSTESAKIILKRQYRGAKVLLVEDDDFNRLVAETLVADARLELDFPHDGLQAVEKAQSAMYASVLMDMQMSNMIGLEATQLNPQHLYVTLIEMLCDAGFPF